MYFELKENRPHGTPENPFSQNLALTGMMSTVEERLNS